jgi:hypothetical protein
VVAYAGTWVYSPRPQQVRLIIVGERLKFWISGHLIHALYTTQWAMQDPFGYEYTVDLKAGWNQVLVKTAGTSLLYLFAIYGRQGLPRHDLVANWSRSDSDVANMAEEAKDSAENFERWYRIEVPAGTRAGLLPKVPPVQAVYLNGREVKPVSGRIEYSILDFRQTAVLALKVKATDEVMSPIVFESGGTDYQLGSWTRTGLTYYAGSAAYEKTFRLSPELTGKQVILDCGRVGVAADVWLNGRKVAERIWRPFAANVTNLLRPGDNQLKIVVTNASDAALRGIPDFHEVPGNRGCLLVWLAAALHRYDRHEWIAWSRSPSPLLRGAPDSGHAEHI